ncbi:hypothetical protein PO124_20295 [Bacillus licheniformis]|nr:hypothetical protein [Bacillus licheniformis]
MKRQISQIDDKLEGLEIMLSQLAYDPRLMNGLADADLQTDFKRRTSSQIAVLLQDQIRSFTRLNCSFKGRSRFS